MNKKVTLPVAPLVMFALTTIAPNWFTTAL